jgi:hypothetical protein
VTARVDDRELQDGIARYMTIFPAAARGRSAQQSDPLVGGPWGAAMGDRDGGTAVTRRADPSWAAVVGTTVRLWWQRRRRLPGVPATRRRGIAVLGVLAAAASGAGLTLAAVAGTRHSVPPRPGAPALPAASLQAAQADRAAAAAWIAQQVSRGVIVSCDPEMCAELQARGFPAGQLLVLRPTAADPLGSGVVVATPAVRDQFGARLAGVYAPLVIASFGAGPEQVQVRYVAPDGSAAFDSQVRAELSARVTAGRQLLGNRNIRARPAARRALLAGDVDPRLLVLLSLLAHQMPLRLVAFDDSAPGVRSGVPLRGAEIGASAPARLRAILAFLTAQRPPYLPAAARIGRDASGTSVIVLQFGAPGPLGLPGSP